MHCKGTGAIIRKQVCTAEVEVPLLGTRGVLPGCRCQLVNQNFIAYFSGTGAFLGAEKSVTGVQEPFLKDLRCTPRDSGASFRGVWLFSPPTVGPPDVLLPWIVTVTHAPQALMNHHYVASLGRNQ